MGNESRLGRLLGIFRKKGEPQPNSSVSQSELIIRAVERQEKLDAEYPTKEKPTGWRMTNPRCHDPDNFRYIVHSITYENDFVASLKGQPLRRFNQRASQRDLQGFLQREVISCSLIDEIHTHTYCQDFFRCHGFIFDVPEKNILALDRGDMGKPWDINNEEEALSARPQSFELRKRTQSAQQFIEGIKSFSGYNEVLVNGVGKGGVTRISGIFLIENPILKVPVYEILGKISQEAIGEYNEFKKLGWSDERILDHRYAYGPSRYRQEKEFADQIAKRYQEAKDLALLLDVPLVGIPKCISAEGYRKYALD